MSQYSSDIEQRVVNLGSVVHFRTGKLDSNAAIPDGAYPFFTCSQETLRTNTFSFDGEYVILAGNNANGVFPLKYFNGRFDAYQRTYVVAPRSTLALDTRFLYYALRPKLEELRSVSTGAATKFLTLGILNSLQLTLPDITDQRRIAGILSAYDDLIENCQRRIRILEEMARSLYREWFVHFRYPDYEAVSLVESVLGLIPRSWEVKKLCEVAEVNRAQITPRTAPEELHYIDISSVSPGQIDQLTPYRFNDAPGRARRIVQHGDILWSCVRPNRRSHAIVLYPEENTIASTGFAVLTARTVPYTYLYSAVTTEEFVSYLSNNATGAAYPAVTATTFQNAIVLTPPGSLLQQFGEVTIPLCEESEIHRRKIRNLRATRDLLLPRLLPGEVLSEGRRCTVHPTSGGAEAVHRPCVPAGL